MVPTQALQESIRQAMVPTQALQESIRQALLPTQALQESIRQALLPTEALQELVRQTIVPTQALQESIQQVFATQRAWQDMFRNALSPSQEAFQETMRHALSQLSRDAGLIQSRLSGVFSDQAAQAILEALGDEEAVAEAASAIERPTETFWSRLADSSDVMEPESLAAAIEQLHADIEAASNDDDPSQEPARRSLIVFAVLYVALLRGGIGQAREVASELLERLGALFGALTLGQRLRPEGLT
jgi:hypothetical protein